MTRHKPTSLLATGAKSSPEGTSLVAGSGERLAYRISEAAAVSGLSRSSIYVLINTGKLRSVKVAGRRLIPRQSLEALFAGSE